MRDAQRWLTAAAAMGMAILILGSAAAESPDWPQFRGPQRDGLCTETGLMKEWPKSGPKLLWKLEGLGRGYSTVAITQGKIFTMGDRKGEQGEGQFVICYDLADRKELWATRIGPPHSDGGPRCTPTVDGELTYAVGTDGDLLCLETATGKAVWKKNFAADFGGKMMSMWKFSESPLVDGEKLLVTPGGKDATIVALNKKTGETIWRCAMPEIGSRGKDGAGYSSMIVAEPAGVRQYIQILGRGAIGVAADTGKFLWGYNKIANNVANITSPIVHGDHVFVTTSYGTGSAVLKLAREGDGISATEVWFDGPSVFENHHGGVVLVGEHLYGGSGRKKGAPVCLEFLTGKAAWQDSPLAQGSAAVLYADGRIYMRYEKNGLMALVEATPEAFKVASTFTPAVNDGPAWPYPVIHDGKLYLRSHNTLMCYDVKQR